ncbi:MAG: hypothetical protein RIA09_15740 [Hoeflea sp.]
MMTDKHHERMIQAAHRLKEDTEKEVTHEMLDAVEELISEVRECVESLREHTTPD